MSSTMSHTTSRYSSKMSSQVTDKHCTRPNFFRQFSILEILFCWILGVVSRQISTLITEVAIFVNSFRMSVIPILSSHYLTQRGISRILLRSGTCLDAGLLGTPAFFSFKMNLRMVYLVKGGFKDPRLSVRLAQFKLIYRKLCLTCLSSVGSLMTFTFPICNLIIKDASMFPFLSGSCRYDPS